MNVVQIGANDGQDHIYEYVEKHVNKINKLILVEPLPQLLPILKDRYSKLQINVEYENVAITDKESEKPLEFYFDIDGGNGTSTYETSTLYRSHLVNLGCPDKKIGVITVPTITFDQLMAKYGLTELHALYIDAEGHDYYIIKSIDFKKYKIHTIHFELDHMDGTGQVGKNADDVKKYLEENNYNVASNRPNSTATLKLI
jgi:FkbM family methyltransferase